MKTKTSLREFSKPLKKPFVDSKEAEPRDYRLVIGDSTNMFAIADGSIGLIVTSPPYYNVKDYSKDIKGDIGNIDSYDSYLQLMRDVFKECYRVLRKGRYCVVNISDVVSGGKKYPIPYDYVGILQEVGFTYCYDIIWQKPLGAGGKVFGVFLQNPYPLYYHPNNVYEHILVFRKGDSGGFRKRDKIVEFNNIRSDIWYFRTEFASRVEHLAPFPMELPRRVVELFSYTDDIILDPFMGSGTTFLACRVLRRSCIGYDINPDFADIISKRVGFNQGSLAGDKFIINLDVGKDWVGLGVCDKCGERCVCYVGRSRVKFECEKCGAKYNNKKGVFDVYGQKPH